MTKSTFLDWLEKKIDSKDLLDDVKHQTSEDLDNPLKYMLLENTRQRKREMYLSQKRAFEIELVGNDKKGILKRLIATIESKYDLEANAYVSELKKCILPIFSDRTALKLSNEICYSMNEVKADFALRIWLKKQFDEQLSEIDPSVLNAKTNPSVLTPLARHWALFFAYLNPSVLDVKLNIEKFCKEREANVTGENVRQQYYKREYNNPKKRVISENSKDIQFVINHFLKDYTEKEIAENELKTIECL